MILLSRKLVFMLNKKLTICKWEKGVVQDKIISRTVSLRQPHLNLRPPSQKDMISYNNVVILFFSYKLLDNIDPNLLINGETERQSCQRLLFDFFLQIKLGLVPLLQMTTYTLKNNNWIISPKSKSKSNYEK